MANPEQVAILQHGIAPWNDWREIHQNRSEYFDLSGAYFKDQDLTGADLRAVNLSKAVLRGAEIGKGSLLWNANLSEADLYGANLRGADLQDVNFSGADLFQADLRESNLQGADLSTAKGGLRSRQLAGSDLTGAKLPEPLAKLYGELSSVKEISSSAQKLFLALLAGCLYSWLTIAQTTDVELITNRATTPLPIIQAAIPIVGFYVVAPLILLCLYFYFHFYLQKLWEELGSLPAIFTDGRPLHNRTDPWLLNDLVRSHFTKLKEGRPFLSYFQEWVSVVLAWWLVPATLFAFWLRFLRRHDLSWTIAHALLLGLAIVSAVRLYTIANQTLRGKERMIFHWKAVLQQGSTYLRLVLALAFAAFLLAVSLGALSGEPSEWNGHSPKTWIPSLLAYAGYSPFPNLEDADVSTRPPTWTGKKDEELDLVKGANLRRAYLRHVRAGGAFFIRADLSGADMKEADLTAADLRHAHLGFAHMELANLFEALLQDARMNYAEMEGALLRSAHLDHASIDYAYGQGAQLNSATLTGASLHNAHFSQASFGKSKLEGADLSESDLTGADFFEANLRAAHIQWAILENAELQRADLQGADLELSDLQGSHLEGANLTGTKLEGANIRYADFRRLTSLHGTRYPTLTTKEGDRTQGLTQEMLTKARNWQFAFYDDDMLKQLGLPPDHNEQLQKQMEAEQQQGKPAADIPVAPKPKIK